MCIRDRLRVWPVEICSPNLVNFDYGVRRCHAVTCISPSLMHLLPLYYTFGFCIFLALVTSTKLHTVKNIRISTDILWRVFNIFSSVFRIREVDGITKRSVGPHFIILLIYGYERIRNRKYGKLATRNEQPAHTPVGIWHLHLVFQFRSGHLKQNPSGSFHKLKFHDSIFLITSSR